MAAIELKGRLMGVAKDLLSKDDRMVITMSVERAETENLAKLSVQDEISVSLRKWYPRRSVSANNLLWECVNEIAAVLANGTGVKLRDEAQAVYLRMLRDYGVTTRLLVEPSMVDRIRGEWKDLEECGIVRVGDRDMMECICCYGSSEYTSQEFARLLDGVISEMEQMDLIPPTKRDVAEAVENWEQLRTGKRTEEVCYKTAIEREDVVSEAKEENASAPKAAAAVEAAATEPEAKPIAPEAPAEPAPAEIPDGISGEDVFATLDESKEEKSAAPAVKEELVAVPVRAQRTTPSGKRVLRFKNNTTTANTEVKANA